MTKTDPAVAAVFAACPPPVRARLLAILFDLQEPPPPRQTIAFCVEAALTYHSRRKRS